MLYTSSHRYEQFGTDKVSFEDQNVTSGFFEDLNFRARNVIHSSGVQSHYNYSVYAPIEQSWKEPFSEISSFSDCSDEQENRRNSCNRATWAYKSRSNSNLYGTDTQGETQETLERAGVTSDGFQTSLKHVEQNHGKEGATTGDHPGRQNHQHCNARTAGTSIKDHLWRYNYGSFSSTEGTKIKDHLGRYNHEHYNADTRTKDHLGRYNHEHYTADTRTKDHLGRYNYASFPTADVTCINFSLSRDIGTRDGYFEAVSDDDCRFRHFRADHLSEIQFENSVPHAPAQWTSCPGILFVHFHYFRFFKAYFLIKFFQ